MVYIWFNNVWFSTIICGCRSPSKCLTKCIIAVGFQTQVVVYVSVFSFSYSRCSEVPFHKQLFREVAIVFSLTQKSTTFLPIVYDTNIKAVEIECMFRCSIDHHDSPTNKEKSLHPDLPNEIFTSVTVVHACAKYKAAEYSLWTIFNLRHYYDRRMVCLSVIYALA